MNARTHQVTPNDIRHIRQRFGNQKTRRILNFLHEQGGQTTATHLDYVCATNEQLKAAQAFDDFCRHAGVTTLIITSHDRNLERTNYRLTPFGRLVRLILNCKGTLLQTASSTNNNPVFTIQEGNPYA